LTPRGVYLLLIYDGSEGGEHYTWDYFHVLGREPGLQSPLEEGDDSDELKLAALIVGGVALLGIAGHGIHRRRAAGSGRTR
jgi:hypothetical protein